MEFPTGKIPHQQFFMYHSHPNHQYILHFSLTTTTSLSISLHLSMHILFLHLSPTGPSQENAERSERPRFPEASEPQTWGLDCWMVRWGTGGWVPGRDGGMGGYQWVPWRRSEVIEFWFDFDGIRRHVLKTLRAESFFSRIGMSKTRRYVDHLPGIFGEMRLPAGGVAFAQMILLISWCITGNQCFLSADGKVVLPKYCSSHMAAAGWWCPLDTWCCRKKSCTSWFG